jgi:molybdopterin/thiamine biosynthesis adenylyltransferase
MLSSDAYFSRQRALDSPGLELLRQSSAVVVGLGNIGGPAAVELARAGIGEMLLIDNGDVEVANLSRGIFSVSDVGSTKVAAAVRVLAERAPFTKVTTLHGDVRVDVPEYIFTKYDVVVVVVDSWSGRMFANRWAHTLPGRAKAVISGGLSGRSWDVVVAMPGTGGGCMQCPHGADIAMSDEDGGCSTTVTGDDRFDPSVSFAGLAAAVHIVAAAVEVLANGSSRRAGRMISFDDDRYRLDVIRVLPGANCEGHRLLREDEFVRVPAADYVVADLAAIVARQIGVSVMPDLAVEREYVTERICSRCGHAEPVYRALVAVGRERAVCVGCGSDAFRLMPETLLPAAARLSELGVAAGKTVRANVRGRWIYVIPTE